MTVTFSKLFEFNNKVFRNIQRYPTERDEFEDLASGTEKLAYAHELTKTYFSASELQYEAIDYIFNITSWEQTRFGNGFYPVWYGSLDLQTGLYETSYHYRRTFLEAPKDFYKKSKKIVRTVFTVNCKAALIDLRDQCDQDHLLTQSDHTHYVYTQQIGLRMNTEGYPGLLTKSARIADGENVVVFNKAILSKPEYFDNYIYEYNDANHEVSITHPKTGKVYLRK